MKRIILACLLALIATPAFAKLPVTVSILPQQYFLERIGGDLVDVTVMVQPGASPASYEPKPRQMAELANAKLYFAIGVPFESAWLDRIQSANQKMTVIHSEKGIDKLPMKRQYHHEGEPGKEADHEEGGHHHGILDPHIWTAPPLVKIMAGNILDALSKTDPANAETYRANYDALIKDIDALDAELKQTFSNIGHDNRFMVYHPAWGYFAHAYGLHQIPIELEGKEPGPKQLAGLIQYAKHDGIRVIFVQPQFSEKSASLIADAIGGTVIKINPLAHDWLDNLRNVAAGFKKALR